MDPLPKLVVGIPAFNEENTISKVIHSIPRAIEGLGKVEVLVVDDGSTDATVKKAKESGADKVVSHGRNEGLGIAFRTLLDHALRMKADIVVTIDADMQFNSTDIPKLVIPILENRADVVTCTRFKSKGNLDGMPGIKKIGNRIFTGLINWLTDRKFTDTQCGFRAYAREAILRTSLQGKFTYTQEVLLDLAFKRMRILEVDCAVKPQREGKSKVVKNWLSYGVKAFTIIIRTIRDYHPLKFFGGLGAALLVMSIVSVAFAVYRFFYLGMDLFTWPLLLGFAFLIMGGLMMGIALLADLYDRQRRMLEDIQYEIRKQKYGG